MSRRDRPINITETFALDFERVASAMRFLMAHGAAYEDHNRQVTHEVLAGEAHGEKNADPKMTIEEYEKIQ